VRGTRFMKQNRAETVQMLADYLRITPAQSAKAYDTSIHVGVFPKGGPILTGSCLCGALWYEIGSALGQVSNPSCCLCCYRSLDLNKSGHFFFAQAYTGAILGNTSCGN